MLKAGPCPLYCVQTACLLGVYLRLLPYLVMERGGGAEDLCSCPDGEHAGHMMTHKQGNEFFCLLSCPFDRMR